MQARAPDGKKCGERLSTGGSIKVATTFNFTAKTAAQWPLPYRAQEGAQGGRERSSIARDHAASC